MAKGRGGSDGAALLVTLSTVAMTIGVLSISLALSSQLSANASSRTLLTLQAQMDMAGGSWVACTFLGERQGDASLPPVTADDLEQFAQQQGQVRIEDEGGKLAVPSQLYAVHSVLEVANLGDPDQGARALAALWNLPLYVKPRITMPLPPPSADPTILFQPEDPRELAAFLKVNLQDHDRFRKLFTTRGQGGVNLNTADEAVLDGMILWQRAASTTAFDLVATGEVANPSGATRPFELLPLPMTDPLLLFAGADPPPLSGLPSGFFDVSLPSLLLPTHTTYRALRQFGYLHQGNALMPPQSWYRDGTQGWGLPISFFLGSAKDLDPLPMARGTALTHGAQVAASRAAQAYRPHDLTQPLGLAWITPESWFMPLSPFSIQSHLEPVAGNTLAPTRNAVLSASAYAGWLSLQGPGLFRATSNMFTFTQSQGRHRSRRTVRLLGGGLPMILASEEEGG